MLNHICIPYFFVVFVCPRDTTEKLSIESLGSVAPFVGSTSELNGDGCLSVRDSET